MGCGFSIRNQMILECLQKEQTLKVSDLVELTGVAIATVRRDLLRLEQEKLIVRTSEGSGRSIRNRWSPVHSSSGSLCSVKKNSASPGRQPNWSLPA